MLFYVFQALHLNAQLCTYKKTSDEDHYQHSYECKTCGYSCLHCVQGSLPSWSKQHLQQTTIVLVEEEEEMNHARYGNKGCRVFKQGGTKLERDFCLRINIPKGEIFEF